MITSRSFYIPRPASSSPTAPTQIPTTYVTRTVRDLEVQYPSGLVSLTLLPEDIISAAIEGTPPELCDFSVAIAASGKVMTFYREGRQWMSLSYRPQKFAVTLKEAIAEISVDKS